MSNPALRTGKHRFQRQLAIRPATLARCAAALEAFYVDHARAAEIGVHPKYRHGSCVVPEIAAVAWERDAKQWDADHDVARPVKPTNKRLRKRDKTPRAANTYRVARRNAADRLTRPRIDVPSRPWPWPDAGKLAAQARHARRKALAA